MDVHSAASLQKNKSTVLGVTAHLRNSEVLEFGVKWERTDSAMRVCWEKGVTQEGGRVRVTGSETPSPKLHPVPFSNWLCELSTASSENRGSNLYYDKMDIEQNESLSGIPFGEF